MKRYALVIRSGGQYKYVGELVVSRKVLVRDKATGVCWEAYEYELPLRIRGLKAVAGFTNETKCSGRPDYELDIGEKGVYDTVFLVDEDGVAVKLTYKGYYLTLTRHGAVEGALYTAHTPAGELGLVLLL